MQELVKICPPGGTVLSPFTGTGTTGVAALREGANSSASNSLTTTEYETGPFSDSPPGLNAALDQASSTVEVKAKIQFRVRK